MVYRRAGSEKCIRKQRRFRVWKHHRGRRWKGVEVTRWNECKGVIESGERRIVWMEGCFSDQLETDFTQVFLNNGGFTKIRKGWDGMEY